MTSLARYALGVLLYNLAVIVWGAYVRATGAGAGCGAHWPLCNGEVVPRAAATQTLIEFSHRATSGVALVAVLVLFVWARRATPSGHPLRRGAAASVVLMLTEALLGAGLVLFQLVADDASAARAVAVAAHLLNTFLLLAALTLSAWWAAGRPDVRLRDRPAARTLLLSALALLLVGASGAVTALGDTLFPSASLAEGLAADVSSTAHFLVRLRTIHPAIAVFVAVVVAGGVWRLSAGRPGAARLARVLTGLMAAQLAAGVLNVVLLAPVWLQLIHLLLADAVWVVFVCVAAERLSVEGGGQGVQELRS